MDQRSPLPHRLPPLSPAPGRADTRAPGGAQATTAPQRRPSVWAESAIDLVNGTDIVELSDDDLGDLMDEFFAQQHKRTA